MAPPPTSRWTPMGHAEDTDSSASDSAPATRKRGRVTSPSLSTASASSAETQAKPRKPTYLLQKEERDELVEELRVLEARLELLKLKAGLPTIHDKNSVAHTQASNLAVEEEIHRNILHIGKFQSLLSRHLQDTPVNPMTTFIHLPKDPEGRRTILESMRDLKVRRAQELSLDRFQYLDPTIPYVCEERFTTDDGLYYLNFFQIMPFEGVSDAKKLFDGLLFFYANLEMSVTEMIGQLTIREEDDMVGQTVWNHRIVTEGDAGSAEELNLVAFSQFYDSYLPHNGTKFGVLAFDTVDIDDLHPYKPEERSRKDFQASYTVSEAFRHGSSEPMAVLKSCQFYVQYPPAFPVPPYVIEKLHENMTRWNTVLIRFLRQYMGAE